MKWYPTPSYLVRRRAILDEIPADTRLKFLEVGCGMGDLLAKLKHMGFSGKGIDFSAEAISAANTLVVGSKVCATTENLEDLTEKFDFIVASEVLEHCKNEQDFLTGISRALVPGGKIILTVPAHMADWDANDDFCGHLRRYERPDIKQLLESNGFCSVRITAYGVPIFNIMKPMYAHLIKKNTLQTQQDHEIRTKKSSAMWLMPDAASLFRIVFNDFTMFPFYMIQKLFYRTDLGKGYLAVAYKKHCSLGKLKTDVYQQ